MNPSDDCLVVYSVCKHDNELLTRMFAMIYCFAYVRRLAGTPPFSTTTGAGTIEYACRFQFVDEAASFSRMSGDAEQCVRHMLVLEPKYCCYQLVTLCSYMSHICLAYVHQQ